MEKAFYESDNLVLYYNEEDRLAEAIWKGFVSGDELKEAVSFCDRLLDEYEPLKWLADNRKLRALRMADQEWLAQTLIPKLAASSLRRMATVISDDLFNQMAIENLSTKGSELVKFDHQFFRSVGAARKWLSEI